MGAKNERDIQHTYVAGAVGRREMHGVWTVTRQPSREGVIPRSIKGHADQAAAVELFLKCGRPADSVADPAADGRARGHGRTRGCAGDADQRRPRIQREGGIKGGGITGAVGRCEVRGVRAVGRSVERKRRGGGEGARGIECDGPRHTAV